MEVIMYREEYDIADSIDNFMNFYYNLQLNYLASDLLDQGMSPQQITDAITKAMKIVAISGREMREHFMPVFTQVNKGIIRDCKLSKLGYSLVLMNACPDLRCVGEWQIKVLEAYLIRA